MDAIPIFSQVKSLVQVMCRQTKEAKLTQQNFSKQCLLVSQCRSVCELIKGDREAAWETQRQCGHFLLTLINGIPVIGHIKGGIHYGLDDKEGGDQAMKAATHTTAVVAGCVGGLAVGGPIGAVIGGIASGGVIDGTITGVDSAINKEFRPYGFLEPLSDPKDAGKWCDAIGGVAVDGFTGHAVARIVEGVKLNRSSYKSAVLKEVVTPDEKFVVKSGNVMGLGRTAGGVVTAVTLMKNGCVVIKKSGQIYKDLKMYWRKIENALVKGTKVFDEYLKPIVIKNGWLEPTVATETVFLRVKDGNYEIWHGDVLIITYNKNQLKIVHEPETTGELLDGKKYPLALCDGSPAKCCAVGGMGSTETIYEDACDQFSVTCDPLEDDIHKSDDAGTELQILDDETCEENTALAQQCKSRTERTTH